jgi:hypothetical protein
MSPPISVLPRAQVGERNTAEPSPANRGQLAAINKSPNGALVVAKEARGFLDTHLKGRKLRVVLDLAQTLRQFFIPTFAHRLPLL